MSKGDNPPRSLPKIIGLVWILIECNLVAGNIFGFASLFSILPRYGISASRCKILDEKLVNNGTVTVTKDCRGQIDDYQLAFALGIGFYNLPAIVIGMVNDFFGPRSLKMVGIVFHLIGWLSLAFTSPGYDWLLMCHTIFISLAGMCTLISSFSIAAHFPKARGRVTALISGSQLAGSVWYAVFQVSIERGLISLSTLAFIWTSFAVIMFGSAMLFLNWRFECLKPSLSSPSSSAVKKANIEGDLIQDSLARHLTNPLFVVVTLFLSCLLLTAALLPVVWFPWIMHLTGNNLILTNHYTFIFNVAALLGFFIAPLCGFIVDYKADRGYNQKILNVSILQTLTWIVNSLLCIICMFQSITAAFLALFTLLFARTMIVAGSQAVITTIFPPQFIGSLLGVMWTTAGIVSFVTYGLTRLATNPAHAWRAWAVVLFLCLIMSGHLFQLWRFYFKSKVDKNKQLSIIAEHPNGHEEEMQTLKSSTDNQL